MDDVGCPSHAQLLGPPCLVHRFSVTTGYGFLSRTRLMPTGSSRQTDRRDGQRRRRFGTLGRGGRAVATRWAGLGLPMRRARTRCARFVGIVVNGVCGGPLEIESRQLFYVDFLSFANDLRCQAQLYLSTRLVDGSEFTAIDQVDMGPFGICPRRGGARLVCRYSVLLSNRAVGETPSRLS